MKKKSILAIMMLITLSTSIFVACDNNKDKKDTEETKIETSVINDKNSSEKIDVNKHNEKSNKKSNDIKKDENSSKEVNKKINIEDTEKNKVKKENKNLSFNAQKAIEIAKQKYGTQNGKILYSYKEEPYISSDKKGYYIKLSSKTMIEQGGTGTLTWLLVTNDGKIIEDPRMN